MKPSLALKVLRAFILLTFLLLAGFVIFCLALSAQAAPSRNAVPAAPAVRQTPPVVRIGTPYRAERTAPKKPLIKPLIKPQHQPSKRRRKVTGLSLTFRCHADCNLPGEDANFQYLQWRSSVQFDRLHAK